MVTIPDRRITKSEIAIAARWAAESGANKKLLWEMAKSGDRQTSVNALWILTHLRNTEKEWLSSLQDGMIDMCLCETDVSKKRMLLQLLRNQEYTIDRIRTDFLDFCLSKINTECEPYAVRAYCIHIAFKMCRHYPELMAELEEHLQMLALQPLTPGLSSARKATLTAITKARK